jgi:hypothetical protein
MAIVLSLVAGWLLGGMEVADRPVASVGEHGETLRPEGGRWRV